MHIKFRGKNACLYRSSWVPKGTAGNTHGYSVQTYTGSLPISAVDIPDALREAITPDEAKYVMKMLCIPAAEAAEQLKRRNELRERDPAWRLEQASQLVQDAAARSVNWPVSPTTKALVSTALAQIRTIEGHQVKPTNVEKSDPLYESLATLKAAVKAVSEGQYGSAPVEGVRSTKTYKLWAEIFETVAGSNDGSLMRALQEKGFAKSRQR